MTAQSFSDLIAKYNPNHDPRNGEFSSGGYGSKSSLERAMRARSTHKPSTVEKQRKAEAEQAILAKALRLTNTPDNHPVDLLGRKIAVEVKTVLDNNNDKITVHPESRRRKEAFAKDAKKSLHTIVIDRRRGKRKYYHKEGTGAFRISGMRRVTLDELKRLAKHGILS